MESFTKNTLKEQFPVKNFRFPNTKIGPRLKISYEKNQTMRNFDPIKSTVPEMVF